MIQRLIGNAGVSAIGGDLSFVSETRGFAKFIL